MKGTPLRRRQKQFALIGCGLLTLCVFAPAPVRAACAAARFDVPLGQPPGRYRIEAEGAGLVEMADLRITSSG